MSKIGERNIEIPDGVTIELKGQTVNVKGQEGEMQIALTREIEVVHEGNNLIIKRKRDDKRTKSLHGLFRSLISNAVSGVQKPWEKKLEIIGTGYSVVLQGEGMIFKVGYSHPVEVKKVLGISFRVEGNNKVSVLGFDKHLVGQVAHKIKMIRKPDVYKGKGIKYEGEVLKIKPGKKAKAAGA